VIATGFGDKGEQAKINKNLLEKDKDNILEFDKAINDDTPGSGPVTSSSIGTGAGKAENSAGTSIPTSSKPYPLTLEELEIPTFIRRQVD
jgi:hypothetical protein